MVYLSQADAHDVMGAQSPQLLSKHTTRLDWDRNGMELSNYWIIVQAIQNAVFKAGDVSPYLKQLKK